MTENGVFSLRKHRKFHKVIIFLITLFFASAAQFFFSCKSTPPVLSSVNPLELIDGENHFFMSIPYSADPSLISTLIEKNVEGIGPEEARMVSKRVSVLHVGMIRSKKSIDFQISGKVDFPAILVKKVFTKKNGFDERKMDMPEVFGLPASYSIYRKDGLDICVPSEKIVLLGRGVPKMLENYHAKANGIFLEAKNPIPAEIFSFLSSAEEDSCMKFYASKPQNFLSMLTGANLSLKLAYVRGTMVQDSNSKEQYRMDLEFEFKDPRFIPLAKGTLSLAFGLTDSEVFLQSPTNLRISNIKIGKEPLYRLLIIK